MNEESPNVGVSLVVQCLGLSAFTVLAQVQSLAEVLRSWKQNSMAKKRERERSCQCLFLHHLRIDPSIYPSVYSLIHQLN